MDTDTNTLHVYTFASIISATRANNQNYAGITCLTIKVIHFGVTGFMHNN